MLQRTLKNYALWKIFSKCVKFGIKSTHFEKKMGHINAQNRKHILYGWLYFSWLKISNIVINLWNASISSHVILTILSIVRSIVMGLKNYCWDESSFASCKLNLFLQTRFCQSFSHRCIIGNSFLPLPGSWTWTHRCFRTVHTPRPRKFPSEHMLYFKEWLMGNEI